MPFDTPPSHEDKPLPEIEQRLRALTARDRQSVAVVLALFVVAVGVLVASALIG